MNVLQSFCAFKQCPFPVLELTTTDLRCHSSYRLCSKQSSCGRTLLLQDLSQVLTRLKGLHLIVVGLFLPSLSVSLPVELMLTGCLIIIKPLKFCDSVSISNTPVYVHIYKVARLLLITLFDKDSLKFTM